MNILKRWVLKSCSAKELQDEFLSRPNLERFLIFMDNLIDDLQRLEQEEKGKISLLDSLKVRWQEDKK